MREPDGPTMLHRFHVVRNKAIFVAVRRPGINAGHTEDAGPHISFARVVFQTALSDQLRPLLRSLSGVRRRTSFRHLLKLFRISTINVLGRSVDEDTVRRHISNDVRSALDVRLETEICRIWILVEVCGQMDYRVIIRNRLYVFRIEDIMTGATREILSVEDPANMGAEITAAAGYKDPHRWLVFSCPGV